MDEALKASYNLPFIHLLESLTPDILAQLLSSTRLSGYHTQTDIDLTGAVGGIALRPLDLLGLYTALAQNGMYQRPTFERHAVRSKPLQTISPGAALLTKRALTTQQRPEFSHATQLKTINGAIHWKTGTSFGHRDAWAIGSNQRYTVLVWLGNFDNQPSRSLVGRESAGPLLFDILSELSAVKNFTSQRLTTLAPLKTIATCAATGYPAHPSCPESRPQQIPVHAPIHAVDPYLRAYRTDPKTGLAINHACRPNASVLAKPFFKLSWAIRQHISPGQLRYTLQPSFAKGCGDVFTSGDLSILEPTPHRTYLLIAGLDAKRQQIRLRADQSGVTGHLDWFVDGEHVGRAHHGHPVYWTPTSGTHRVSVKNGAGIVKHGKFRVL